MAFIEGPDLGRPLVKDFGKICGLFHVPRPRFLRPGACFVKALKVANYPYGRLMVAFRPYN